MSLKSNLYENCDLPSDNSSSNSANFSLMSSGNLVKSILSSAILKLNSQPYTQINLSQNFRCKNTTRSHLESRTYSFGYWTTERLLVYGETGIYCACADWPFSEYFYRLLTSCIRKAAALFVECAKVNKISKVKLLFIYKSNGCVYFSIYVSPITKKSGVWKPYYCWWYRGRLFH